MCELYGCCCGVVRCCVCQGCCDGDVFVLRVDDGGRSKRQRIRDDKEEGDLRRGFMIDMTLDDCYDSYV